MRPAVHLGLQRWEGGVWIPAKASVFADLHENLLARFLGQVRSPFVPARGKPWFGKDDLAFTSLRPRHDGLDVGARIEPAAGQPLETLPAGTPFRTILPGGYLLGGKNHQRIILIHRKPPHRLRLVVQVAYEHGRFEGKARGRVRLFSRSDQADYLHTPSSYGVAIREGNRIVGYEALDWTPNPGGWAGTLADGRYVTKDPELARRKVPKGPHLHLRIEGVFDDDLPRKRAFLNDRLRPALERI